MSQRTELYIFLALLVALGGVIYYSTRTAVPGLTGVLAADARFQPLDVQAPDLHLDQLAALRKDQYAGSHRNIFVAEPPPPPKAALLPGERADFMGPKRPPPPPPLQIPAVFFGYASRPPSGRRVAFFTSGDDVLVVAEGDTFLGQYRLVHIGNDSADVQEISSGRHAQVPLLQAPDEVSSNQGPNP
jgi:hypothetical protein